ncbi:hypothetical protein BT96DRAFT_978962 [Gymnopus androsaceus JB14]|uniref:Uncharacterized protein n=1 Tax=Gymnopus androsaceus JB14 TaxID=1447944 RepID=A0A6A4H869_9AGAR|nr:hypothetical protein BT96DRAFT_978962 [Gymnopus androsaceus JB14]
MFFLCIIILMKIVGILWLRAATHQNHHHVWQVSDVRQLSRQTSGYDSSQPLVYAPKWDIPSPRKVRMSMEETTHYQLDSPEADAEWKSLYPGEGVVYLPVLEEDIDYGMSNDHQKALPFTLSMFHQLQCLDIVRKEIVRHHKDTLASPSAVVSSQLAHHCINHLRQMALCRSDMYLSPVIAAPEPKAYALETYECND